MRAFRLLYSSLIQLLSIFSIIILCLWNMPVSASVRSPYENSLIKAGYEVFTGDVNSDGYPDVLLRAKFKIALIDFKVSIPVLLKWRDSFLVLSNQDGSYSIAMPLSESVLNSSVWQRGGHELIFGDTDGDGSQEMLVRALGTSSVSVLIASSNSDGTPELRQRLNSLDLGGATLAVDLLDTDGDGRADLLTSQGMVVQSILVASPEGMLKLAPPTVVSAMPVEAGASAVVVSTVAGATTGRFGVTGTGSAVYDIPLWMPSASNGLQPAIGLHYDSRRGRSVMGPGWSISGLGSISRCNKTYAQDVAPSNVALATTDGYCLDGKRLRLTGGTYGAAASTYQTEGADFSQVTAYGTAGNGPAYFFVQRKDGRIYEYGNTNSGANTARVTASGSSTPYQWRLNKVRDRDGNNYAVTYGVGQTGSVGVGVPLSVSYAPTSAGASTYRYSVSFTYLLDTEDGTEVGYVAGGSTVNKNLLTRIEVRQQDTSKFLRAYELGYEISPVTNRNRLVSVQECSDLSLTSCLEPALIAYQNGSTGISTSSNPALASSTSVKGAYDLNGDRRSDIIYKTGDTLYVSFATINGYGSPVSTGINLAAGDAYDVGDLVASGKDDIFVTRNGIWYRFYWNGTSFGSVSSGVSLGSDERVLAQPSFLTDINGDGSPDLVTRSPDGQKIYTRLNASSNGVLSFSAIRSLSFSAGSGSTLIAVTVAANPNAPHEKLDFNGDGRGDIYVTYYGEFATGGFYILSNGTTFSGGGQVNQSPYTASQIFLRWNDDSCTDIIDADTALVKVASCGGFSSQTIHFNGTAIGSMDWNGDGRADLLVNSGGNIGVYLSTGSGIGALIATAIPVTTGLMVLDQNGDGLDDVASVSGVYPFPVIYRLHNGSGAPPDLATSITDGFGLNFSPTYISIAQGSYTKVDGAVAPERELKMPIYVVKQFQASDGIGGSYTKTYAYSGAQENIQGRGFSGFQSVRTSDSRSNTPVTKSYYKTVFPYTGLLYQQDIYQSNGTTLIAKTVSTPALITLSSTTGQQRYFPYIGDSTAYTYEVGGSKNGQLIKQISSSLTYDNYGNVTNSTTTLTDTDSTAPQSPTYNQSWTTIVYNSFNPNTANWCLGIPIDITTTRSATGVTEIVRTSRNTADYVKCRITQQVVEPNSATLKATVNYTYDAFGNLNSQTVTGINMLARTTTTNWGTTGQFPVSVTNALSQTTSMAYDYGFGVLTSVTDPNNIVTSWTHDAFGRIASEVRPDGTSTAYSYKECADVSGGCQNGDPDSTATGINRLVITSTVKDSAGAAMRDDWAYLDQFGRPIVNKSKMLMGGYSRVGTQYDAWGRLRRRTAPCDASSCTAYWTTSLYDQVGRMTEQSRRISALDSGEQITAMSYQGMTTVVTDPYLKTTTKSIDPNGWLRRSKDHDGYYQSFAYDAFGSLKAVTDSQSNNLFSATYDYGLAAFRLQTVDMDLGTWGYTPNALGEVVSSSDANGNNFSQTYDKLSRPLTRVVTGEGTTILTWGNTAASYNIGKLQSLSSTNGTTETYSYDNKGRLSQTQIVSDATYLYNASYSATTGLLDTLTYPTSTSGYRLKLQYGYQNGLLKRISDFAVSSTIFWQASATNPRFQVTEETLGNGVVTNRGFDAVTGQLSTLQSGISGGSGVQNESYSYDKIGNVTQRKNIAANLTETFYYDNLYRLDYSQLNGITNLDLSYNALGNITGRCEPTCGAAWAYHATKKHAVTQASVGSTTYNYSYDSNGNVINRNGYSITWSKDNYPTLINGASESVALFYDANFRRWKQVYTQSGVVETTIYAGDLLEKVTKGGVTDWRHSIRANGKSVALVSRTSSGANATRYVLEDHQGSVDKLLSGSGATVISESFTAFGARRNASTWSGAPSASDLTTINGISRSGYTGHDALGALGLNHMDGRIQDSLTGRFLSADPHMTDPGNTQNFNRYSYVYNNPLSAIDPSGFEAIPVLPVVTVTDTLVDVGTDVGDALGSVLGGLFKGAFGGLFGGGGSKPPPPAAEPRSFEDLCGQDSACQAFSYSSDGSPLSQLSGVTVNPSITPAVPSGSGLSVYLNGQLAIGLASQTLRPAFASAVLAAGADGPLPIGDLYGAGLLGAGIIYSVYQAAPGLGDALKNFHGNAYDSPLPNTVYQLVSNRTDEVLKYGITSNPNFENRYPSFFYSVGNFRIEQLETYPNRALARADELARCSAFVEQYGRLPRLSLRC